MPNDEKPSPPSAFDDVRKGLGLLFRAAKTVAQKIPTDPLEKVVLDGAREVGRAVENVATTVTSTLEKQVFGKDSHKKPADEDEKRDATSGDTSQPHGSKPSTKSDDGSHDGPKPRVG
jgi:hypothetical protein